MIHSSHFNGIYDVHPVQIFSMKLFRKKNVQNKRRRHFLGSFYALSVRPNKKTNRQRFSSEKLHRNISNNTCDRLIHIKYENDKNQEPTKEYVFQFNIKTILSSLSSFFPSALLHINSPNIAQCWLLSGQNGLLATFMQSIWLKLLYHFPFHLALCLAFLCTKIICDAPERPNKYKL